MVARGKRRKNKAENKQGRVDWVGIGCLSEFWRGARQSMFVLRQAQHERQILNKFNPSPVRPELVEGGTAGLQSTLT